VLSVVNSDVRLYNAALNRPAYMSGVHNNPVGQFKASLANDGIFETNAVLDSKPRCAHSAKRIHPWWAVDLGHPLTIVKVNLTNRGDNSGIALLLPREATRSAVLPRQVVCLSVRPSVCLSDRLYVTLRYRDHIGWNSAKVISRPISLTISLSAEPSDKSTSKRKPPNLSRNRSGV